MTDVIASYVLVQPLTEIPSAPKDLTIPSVYNYTHVKDNYTFQSCNLLLPYWHFGCRLAYFAFQSLLLLLSESDIGWPDFCTLLCECVSDRIYDDELRRRHIQSFWLSSSQLALDDKVLPLPCRCYCIDQVARRNHRNIQVLLRLSIVQS